MESRGLQRSLAHYTGPGHSSVHSVSEIKEKDCCTSSSALVNSIFSSSTLALSFLTSLSCCSILFLEWLNSSALHKKKLISVIFTNHFSTDRHLLDCILDFSRRFYSSMGNQTRQRRASTASVFCDVDNFPDKLDVDFTLFYFKQCLNNSYFTCLSAVKEWKWLKFREW